jgi:hypothetical protein
MKGGGGMKANKIKEFSTDAGKRVVLQDSLTGTTIRVGEMHLLIIAIDPVIPMGVKSVTLQFPNREEGLQAFNALAATAKNVHKTYVEDVRPHAKARAQVSHL